MMTTGEKLFNLNFFCFVYFIVFCCILSKSPCKNKREKYFGNYDLFLHVNGENATPNLSASESPPLSSSHLRLRRLISSNFTNVQEGLKFAGNKLLVAEEGFSQEVFKLLEKIPQRESLTKNITSMYMNFDAKTKGLNDGFISGKSGHCKKEDTYKIAEASLLHNYMNELECIFARGIAPLKPPTGLWYGEVLSVGNSVLLNGIVENLWAGKIAVETQCRGADTSFYMLFNFIANSAIAPAYLYVGKLRDSLAVGEYDDHKESLFVDYTVDFANVCPPVPNSKQNINLGIINDPFFFNQITDTVRVVGKQADGGYILLGKSYLRDANYFPDIGDTLVAWWLAVNYDKSAYPQNFDWTLPPLEESFDYHTTYALNTIQRLIGLSEILTNPGLGVPKFVDARIRRPLGFPPLSKNAKEFENIYVSSGIPSNPNDVLLNRPNQYSYLYYPSGRLIQHDSV